MTPNILSYPTNYDNPEKKMSGSRVHPVSLLYKSLYDDDDDDDIIIIGKKKWRLLVTTMRYIPVTVPISYT